MKKKWWQFAGTRGYADEVPVDRITDWERALLRNIESSHPEVIGEIAKKKEISEETESKLRDAILAFMKSWQA